MVTGNTAGWTKQDHYRRQIGKTKGKDEWGSGKWQGPTGAGKWQ